MIMIIIKKGQKQMPVIRNSRQRAAILENLLSRYDHPTAEEVYESVRKTLPNISLATVYRNLNMMVEDGTILSVITKDMVHFDAHTESHRHVICNKCGKIFDIDVDITKEILMKAQNAFDGEIDSCKLIFYGICKDCKNNN